MYIRKNGELILATEEYAQKTIQEGKQQSQNPAPPTDAERLEALESWKSDIEESYVMGVNSL